MQETLMTNVVGSAYMSQAFVGLVEISAKKTIVNISSSFGSISIDAGVACVSYAVSKAGLNMLVRGGCSFRFSSSSIVRP